MIWIDTVLHRTSELILQLDPHFRGLWEAAVKSMELLLAKVVGPHSMLYSVPVKIESVLNSRPLTPLDSAPDDGIEVLTPGHFLVGKALKSVPS